MQSTIKNIFLMLFVLSVNVFVASGVQPLYAANIRSSPVLQSIWNKLDAARTYRKDWRGLQKTHKQLITDYLQTPVAGYEPKTSKELFIEAAREFESLPGNPLLKEEATWGLQEALNEIMAGQVLVGNDYLIKGLRVRFPCVGDPEDPDQLTLLSWSAQSFQDGLDEIMENLRTNPDCMRTGNIGYFAFPFFVENSVTEPGPGEIVESEFYRFTDLIERWAMAGNLIGKRIFFFENVTDVDNYPYGNFPGDEDIDLNGNGILDKAGRDEAAQQFKRSAHATYLQSAVLATLQTEKDFDQNNGHQLKRQILDAQRIFDDILSGFNPLHLLGDFVPHQNVENFLSLARKAVEDAIVAERAAKNASRLYDQDETTLRQTLESQQLTYLNRIEAITGLSVKGVYDLRELEERERLFSDTKINAENGTGEIGRQMLARDEAIIATEQAYETFRQIPEKIRIEEERCEQVSEIVLANGKKFAALSVAEIMYSSITVNTSGGISFNPFVDLLGSVRSERDILSAIQHSQIEGIQSAATIKQLLLDQALALISVQRANKIVEQENAKIDELWADLERTIRNYLTSLSDLTEAYFMNPAYRLDRDQLYEAAETTFEGAMVECYYAAKALEYLWSEKYNNPVNRLDGGIPQALSPTYDPYIRAESVFAVKFAEIKSPNLDHFLDTLNAWDIKMRQLRTPERQCAYQTISMRRDILGFDGLNEAYNRLLFRDFIAKHRVEGLNLNNPDLIFEFSLELADEKLFPAHSNIKIEEIRIYLVSTPERSIRGNSTSSAPALVDLIMLDEAAVRSFFSDYPEDDDLLVYDLEEGRTLEKSPFYATVDATIDGDSSPPAVTNTQLAGHSPGVTRWTLRIKMNRGNNKYLCLEFLDDIELEIKYCFGKPQQISFP